MSERAEVRITPDELMARSEIQAPIILMPDMAAALQGNVEQLGAYLVQMAQLMTAMQRRMDEMEANQRRVTADHGEVKHLTTLIKLRAGEYCEKYQLTDTKDVTAVRNAIRKAILVRYGVRDLHDCPQVALQAIQKQIDNWADIRLVMKIREKHRGGA